MYKIGSNSVIPMDIKKSVDTLVGIVDSPPLYVNTSIY